jgi:hypothetical protein
MKRYPGRLAALLFMTGLAFATQPARAQGYRLRLVENKHDQAVLLLDPARSPAGPRILETGRSIGLAPGATYLLGFADAELDALDAECPFLRVGLCAESKDLDVEIPFDYVQVHDRPDALIEKVQSPVAYSEWLGHLKAQDIRIYFGTVRGWTALPGLDASPEAKPRAEPDGPAPGDEESKAVAPPTALS